MQDLNTKFYRLLREQTLFKGLLTARQQWGGRCNILCDNEGQSLNYEALITRSFALGQKIKFATQKREHVGLLLPTSLGAVVTFFALQAYGRIPTLLNFSAGSQAILSACHTAQVNTIYTSRRFITEAKLTKLIHSLKQQVKIIYLEEVAQRINFVDKVLAKCKSKMAHFIYKFIAKDANPHQEAVILFTSGSEGTPKGVALSHVNIQANRAQALSVLDLQAHDILLNVLPLFHSFGLTALLLALLSGIKTILYPSPLDYQNIPAIIQHNQATIFFATDTFLQGYAHYAKPEQLKSLRLVFAGAEKLREATRLLWKNKFALELLEGYGTTETAPIISLNTPHAHKPGTVGRLLPGMDYQLLPVEGITGGRLKIIGPNVMLGYYHSHQPGQLTAAENQHDTGDIVHIDNEGYIRIAGRARRFAKMAGEMISLQAVEQFIDELWPEAHHAVLNIPHLKHGETLVLLTNHPAAKREDILHHAQTHGLTELMCPKRIIILEEMPLLASGKVNYQELEKFL